MKPCENEVGLAGDDVGGEDEVRGRGGVGST